MSFINPKQVIDNLNLKPGMRVADFGCGSGDITILMAKTVGDSGEVFAIDVLISALESVQGKASLENIRNIKTIRSNLEILKNSGLDNNSMDLVLLANILFQSKLKKNIIEEAKRVLKSGARVVIIDWKSFAEKLGPPKNLRVNKEKIKKIAKQLDFKISREFDLGEYHFAMELVKP